jgi:hypothetical protein
MDEIVVQPKLRRAMYPVFGLFYEEQFGHSIQPMMTRFFKTCIPIAVIAV